MTDQGRGDGVQHGEVDARLRLARLAAADAARLTLRYFQSPDLVIETKSNNTPVTIADKKTEELLRAHIAREFPGDGVLGEEFGRTEGSSGYTWILDPIDGTQSFVHGIPTYAVLIGIERDGQCVAGVCEVPGMQETLWGSRGAGAWWSTRNHEPRRARVSATPTLDRAWIELAQTRAFQKSGRWGLFEELVSRVWRTSGWIDADAFALVCTGRVDAAVQWGVNAWDIAPFDCILHEAGGRMTRWDGQRTLHAKSVLASNGFIHDALVEILRRHAPAETP